MYLQISSPFGFCATFLNDFLQQERGMTKEAATGVLVTFGAGNAIGVVIGGLLGRSYKKDVRLPPLFMGISLIIGCIPFYFFLNHVSEDANTALTTVITFTSGALVVVPVPLERAILTNVCLPRSRGRANALVSITDDLGKGLVSDALQNHRSIETKSLTQNHSEGSSFDIFAHYYIR